MKFPVEQKDLQPLQPRPMPGVQPVVSLPQKNSCGSAFAGSLVAKGTCLYQICGRTQHAVLDLFQIHDWDVSLRSCYIYSRNLQTRPWSSILSLEYDSAAIICYTHSKPNLLAGSSGASSLFYQYKLVAAFNPDLNLINLCIILCVRLGNQAWTTSWYGQFLNLQNAMLLETEINSTTCWVKNPPWHHPFCLGLEKILPQGTSIRVTPCSCRSRSGSSRTLTQREVEQSLLFHLMNLFRDVCSEMIACILVRVIKNATT